MTEYRPYEVVERYPGFEARRYLSHDVAEVSVYGSFGGAGNQAFRALVRYITGHNESAGSIAMTAPVLQKSPGSEKIAMAAAAPRYSGRWSESACRRDLAGQ